jgi:hypothetical protein
MTMENLENATLDQLGRMIRVCGWDEMPGKPCQLADAIEMDKGEKVLADNRDYIIKTLRKANGVKGFTMIGNYCQPEF